jgi:hypothetical protein
VALKAIDFPSRDHAKRLTAVSAFVNWIASPPAGRIAKIWFLSPARELVNASHSPLGDHCALPADLSPRVS